MEEAEIRKHWIDWAQSFGTDIRATTRGPTAKMLEVDALRRRLLSIFGERPFHALEVGCGNGVNCIEMSLAFPTASFDGVDFVPEMIDAALENSRSAGVEDRTRFVVGDVTHLEENQSLRDTYDVVLTDRCLINLNTSELQGRAISDLSTRLKPGAFMLMIENSLYTFGRQNLARRALGLQQRQPSEFNRFFTEEEMAGHIAAAGLDCVETEDFSSLHDLVLYALLPSTNGGTIDYENPLVSAAAQLSAEFSAEQQSAFGAFGQNRLYICRKQ